MPEPKPLTVDDRLALHRIADRLWALQKPYQDDRPPRATPLTPEEIESLKADCTTIHAIAEGRCNRPDLR